MATSRRGRPTVRTNTLGRQVVERTFKEHHGEKADCGDGAPKKGRVEQ